ncbi:hypothetical protein AVEN_18267-1 [Araneus ventricosus]|uniref:Uncharacterized protein n=1 Tax=Araneus ventricosus TaxID=182803 RepID=A0A4Y2AJE6_ARAVE|nr:hypothetical protein AVEN_18267-1 [Araneus ventricosus]
MYRSDGRCNSSSPEAGVVMAVTGHGPTPLEGSTDYHRQRASPSYYCTHQGSETPFTYLAASHLRTRGASSGTTRGSRIPCKYWYPNLHTHEKNERAVHFLKHQAIVI